MNADVTLTPEFAARLLGLREGKCIEFLFDGQNFVLVRRTTIERELGYQLRHEHECPTCRGEGVLREY